MEPKPIWHIPAGTGFSVSTGDTAGIANVVEADMLIAEYEAALAEVGAYINRCLEDDSHFPLADAVTDINFYYKDVARLLWPGDPQPTDDWQAVTEANLVALWSECKAENEQLRMDMKELDERFEDDATAYTDLEWHATHLQIALNVIRKALFQQHFYGTAEEVREEILKHDKMREYLHPEQSEIDRLNRLEEIMWGRND